MRNHNDTNNKDAGRFLYKYMYLSLYCKGSKRVTQGFEKGYSRFACETEQKLQYYDLHSYGHQRCVLLVLQMLKRRPRGSALCWMMAFFTASYHQLLWTKTHQGPKDPLCRFFSTTSCLLTRLISNCNCLDFCLD